MAYGLQFHIEVENKMVNRWIEEDTKFIFSALGNNGKSILKKQQNEFGDKTLEARLEFIHTLIDLVSYQS